MSVNIVELMPQDWRRYRTLRLDSLRTDPAAFGANLDALLERPDDYWIDILRTARLRTKSWAFFAESDGELVASIGSYRTDADLVELTGMYVVPALRSRGIGRMLIEAIQPVLQDAGFQTWFLYVAEGQVPAIRLYQACGFTQVPSNWEGKLRFEKSLGI
jgi:GNAT superfamily N-acetyltransferase